MMRRTGAGLALVVTGMLALGGCSGMPGAPGAGGQAQQGPPGLASPPGMKTGGAKTVLGTAVTAPDNSVLSVRFELVPSVSTATTAADYKGVWHHCRRIIVSDGVVVVEGIGFDKPNATQETEANIALPNASVSEFSWRYEPEIAPPSGTETDQPGGADAAKGGKEKPVGK